MQLKFDEIRSVKQALFKQNEIENSTVLCSLAWENIRFSSLFDSPPFLLAQNVPGGEEREDADVFAGYVLTGTVKLIE